MAFAPDPFYRRRDRLHRNYLRRKVSGAQKRYEDKVKAVKKSGIEAKKAAIQTEDIANDVFIPVGSLPRQAPQKATSPASVTV